MTTPDVLEVALDVSAVPARPAGAGRYIVEIARALSARPELELELISRRGDAERWRQLAPGAGLLPLVPNGRPARLAFERLQLGRAVSRRLGAGAVYHGPHYTLPGGLALGRVVTVHDLTFFDHPEWHERAKVPFFRAAITRAAETADVIVCVSRTTAGRLRQLLSVRGEVVVAEHGVDRERFSPGPPDLGALPAELVSFLGPEPLGRRLVLHVGTLEPRKGVVDLVRAFSILARGRPALRLVLAGLPGWGAGEVSRAVSESAVAGQVRQLGWVPDAEVVTLMRAAGAVAYPSHEEGFGLPALEAMACGSPLVTSAGTAMAEFAGESAYLAVPGDPEALAAALASCLGSDDAERRTRAEIGLERSARYTWEAAADRHIEAYRLAAEAAVARGGHRSPRSTSR